MKFFALLSKAGINGFLLFLIAVVAAAWLYPEAGSESSPLPLRQISHAGVALIFFFYGLRLSPEKIRAGLGHIKLHVVVQAATFVLFPALVLLGYALFYNDRYELWWIGIFYVAALPSTVSSSVVMVSVAGGNISAAIFNASLSSLIGIVVTPLWMSFFVSNSAFTSGSLSGILVDLSLQVLLPVIAGIVLHRKWWGFAERYKNGLRYFDQFIILLIVYRAFCDSFASGMFSTYGIWEIFSISAIMLALFLVLLLVMSLASSMLGFAREDRITIIFCGSKKSLVQGAVMGQVLFPQTLSLGMLLLPLMLYHALQLLAGSILAQRMAQSK